MDVKAAVAFEAGRPLSIESVPLDDINTAFDLMHEGESIRSVVVYS